MPSITTDEPLYYVIWFRAGAGERWRKAGRASSHAEALTMIGGKGDWHIAPLYNPELDSRPGPTDAPPTEGQP